MPEALASFEKALALKPDYEKALFNRGEALSQLGRQEDAIASYDAALAIRPENGEALLGRADSLLQLGRLDAALAATKRT